MKIGSKLGSAPATKMPNMINLDSSELPEIKNWKPGQKYRIVLDVEQTSYNIGDYDGTNKDLVRASFKINSAKAQYGGGAPKTASASKPDKSATMDALQRKAGKSY